jgi:DNA-directed RNA polymerase specialized sigma24 family protein
VSYYQRRISLHDVEDVEAVCVRAARLFREQNCPDLPELDFQALVQFLVVAVWKMSKRYDPELSTSFKAIVHGRLRNRCVDWFRTYAGRTRWQFRGRTYERSLPVPASLDAPAGDSGDTLGASVGTVDRDLAASTDPDPFGGLLVNRGREEARDTAIVRELAGELLRERSRAA